MEKRPSPHELTRKLAQAHEFLENRHGIFAEPLKNYGEINDLDIDDSDEIWSLIKLLIKEIKPEDYIGTRPPMKSYEKSVFGHDLFAFSWFSPKMKKQMYIKFVLKNSTYYYVSLHECRRK